MDHILLSQELCPMNFQLKIVCQWLAFAYWCVGYDYGNLEFHSWLLTCRSKRKRAYFQTYMKLPPNSIAQALLELYSSSLGQPDYKILVASASGMVAMRSQVWTRCDNSARDFHLQFVVFLQTNRIEVYFPLIHYLTLKCWFSSDTRTCHMWASSITALSCLHTHYTFKCSSQDSATSFINNLEGH
jgi:hypothetical protein